MALKKNQDFLPFFKTFSRSEKLLGKFEARIQDSVGTLFLRSIVSVIVVTLLMSPSLKFN